MNEKILIVDDEQGVRCFLSRSLKYLGYSNTVEASSGEEGFEIFQRIKPDLVIADIHMPGKGGLVFLKEAKKCLPNTGFIMMTASDDLADAISSLNHGADRYVLKPLDIDEVQHGVRLVLEKYRLVLENKEYQKDLEGKVRLRTEELFKSLQELDQATKEIKASYIETIHRLTVTAEYRDELTGFHIKRIGYYSRLLAKELGLAPERAEVIFHSSPMHDLGKVGIPDKILLKSSPPLTPEEFNIMKTHAQIGASIFEGSSSEYLKTAEKIALTHHENWDGTGYPSGLKNEAIPIEGQIVKIADVYDALRSRRSYKPCFNHEKACRIITKGDKKTRPEHFAPVVLKAFQKLNQDFDRIFTENQ
ncbi:MAG: HD domain-containing phosphohydrolase [Candidatus Ratteibacteria bacterium]|jgi:putative two-component system response regulator